MKEKLSSERKGLQTKSTGLAAKLLASKSEAAKLKEAQEAEIVKLQAMTKNHQIAKKIMVDLDQDGIENQAGFCPRTLEAAVVGSTGCQQNEEIDLVFFDFESSALLDKAKAKLDNAATVLSHHTNQIFMVHGRTDSFGNI